MKQGLFCSNKHFTAFSTDFHNAIYVGEGDLVFVTGIVSPLDDHWFIVLTQRGVAVVHKVDIFGFLP